MKKHIFWILFLTLVAFSNTAYGKDNFVFSSQGNISGYTVKMGGPFSEPEKIAAGDLIVSYIATHNQFSSIMKGAQYKFLGRTGDKTFQLESWSSTFDTKEVINCYLDPSEPIVLKGLSFIYLPNSKDNDFKLKIIALKGNSLVCQVIAPDEWKPYFQKK